MKQNFSQNNSQTIISWLETLFGRVTDFKLPTSVLAVMGYSIDMSVKNEKWWANIVGCCLTRYLRAAESSLGQRPTGPLTNPYVLSLGSYLLCAVLLKMLKVE